MRSQARQPVKVTRVIADQLPPEIVRQIHPDRRRNEMAYWAVPDDLLSRYHLADCGMLLGTSKRLPKLV